MTVNPYASEEALLNSTCAIPLDGRLMRARDGSSPGAVQSLVHDSLRAHILSPAYPCLGARACFNSGRYAIGTYDALGSPGASLGLARDLFEFIQQQDQWEPLLSTFAACFTTPVVGDELAFEAALWRQLEALHRLDRHQHGWDPSVSADPADPDFSFSFAGRAFFVVGLHAGSSRWSRRFAWPTLIFNAHRQFQRLRERKQLIGMQERIRARDRMLQGDVNPNLADFGTLTEARQYSGRAVEEGWKCPFQPAAGAREPS